MMKSIELGEDVIYININEHEGFKDFFKRYPDLMIELVNSDIKLSAYQKTILRLMSRFEKLSWVEMMAKSRQGERMFLHNLQVNMAKALEMDFIIAKPNKMEYYKKGKLIKTEKHN